MRLAATLTTMRDAERQPVALRGTLRDAAAMPRDVVILDVSSSGFMAELPDDVEIAPGMRVRIAATAFGVHEAIAVRAGEGGHGFAFVRPLTDDRMAALDAQVPSPVTAFPGAMLPNVSPMPAAVPAAGGAVADKISARASLALMVAISLGLWMVLVALVAAATFLG